MTTILDQLTQDFSRSFREESVRGEQYADLFKPILSQLAHGRPVTPKEIAEVTGRPREKIAVLLPKLPNVELDDAGNLVGLGLTLKPTPHSFKLEEQTLYTWCALDALMFPKLLGKMATIESPCKGTDQPVRVVITPDGIEKVEPPSAVVSIVTSSNKNDIRSSFCCNVHFFQSDRCASNWLAQHPNAKILPISEAYELGASLAENLFN
ncbi:MAG: hypothetical protein AXW12_18040 [Thalassospira sp. Nap_22]|jgi:alkylmercury lyase|nr:MAG: hypothetical protein AXW12_18040 [Thalassospira sp. Nap_22]MDF1762012.1 organomercurial lyase MerB [Thalassolituus sp.]